MEAALAAASLRPRLRLVARMVLAHGPASLGTVADVGTDHARLLAWLRAQRAIARGIGIDVVEGPLSQARRTLEAAGVDGVQLRRGDGLQPLRPGEADVVVLAGMGGARMMQLVDAAAPGVLSSRSRLVLQPNTDWPAVRRWIAQRGFALLDERMVEDRGKFYVVLALRPGGDEPSPGTEGWTDDELALGPSLLVERPPVFTAWLRHEARRVERALSRARLGGHADDPRRVQLGQQLARLRAALEHGTEPSPDQSR